MFFFFFLFLGHVFTQFDQYECGRCHKRFNAVEGLIKHEKYSCTAKKRKQNRFMCAHCPYTSNISTNFKNHLLTHSTERPFTCPVCGMGFIQKQNMKNHLVQHNKSKVFT